MTIHETTTRRSTIFLVVLTVLLVPVFGGLATASENLPSGVTFSSPGAQQKVKTYQALSKAILSGKLTPLVEKTTQGEIFLGAEWVRHCNTALGALAALKRERAIPDSLNKWYANEQTAWLNIRTIGAEMLDHHYTMASTHEEIDQDAKDCEAFFKFWKDRATKANSEAGQINDLAKALNAAGDNFDKISGIVGDLSSNLSELQGHFDVLTRITRVFRTRKFEFIKKKDLEGPYRDKLSKLKSKKIDPDATGVFYEFEKKWEETMQRTYQKYVAAVAAWKKANQWWWTKDEWKKITFTVVSKGAQMAAQSWLGVPLPSTSLADPEKLGDWVLAMRKTLTKVVEKAQGMEFARLNDEMLNLEEKINQAYATFIEEVEAADMEARMNAVGVEEKHEKTLLSLEREDQKAHAQLARAGTDKQQEQAAWKEIRRVEVRMIAEQRMVQKEKRYWLEDWFREQKDNAFDKREAAVKKYKAKLKELNGELPK